MKQVSGKFYCKTCKVIGGRPAIKKIEADYEEWETILPEKMWPVEDWEANKQGPLWDLYTQNNLVYVFDHGPFKQCDARDIVRLFYVSEEENVSTNN